MSEQRVYNVTIDGKNDFVIMTEGELMITKMKHMPNFQMQDLTESHGITAKYVYKIKKEMPEAGPDHCGWKDGLMRSCGKIL